MEVKHSLLELNDNLFNVGLLLREQKSIFTLEEGNVMPSTYTRDNENQIVASIVFTSSSHRIKVSRVAYGLLDYLADIGGLFGTFNGFATVFTIIVSY